MNINADRLWNHIQELGKLGSDHEGAITRFPFTKIDQEAMDLIKRWMQDAGLDTHIDAVGNLIGVYHGQDDSLPPIICGSHYDSVKQGGKFDGCLGILAGIEAVQTMREQNISLTSPIYIIAFKDEEGNRFSYGMIGSNSISGVVDPSGLNSMDDDGITLSQAMIDAGFQPDAYPSCEITPMKSYIELHIEQGRVLEEEHAPIGVVEGIAGIDRYDFEIHGVSGHAGATPMDRRQDPVIAMSALLLKIEEFARIRKPAVATIGSIKTFPGAANIICDHVEFTLDMRSIHENDMKQIAKDIRAYADDVEAEYGVEVFMELKQSLPPALCDDELRNSIKQSCEELDIKYIDIMSGAGHDAMNFKGKCPIAMIFVPSKEGCSHRKEEYTSKEECEIGANVLYEVLLKQAK